MTTNAVTLDAAHSLPSATNLSRNFNSIMSLTSCDTYSNDKTSHDLVIGHGCSKLRTD